MVPEADYHYDAFISYRHIERDEAIAQYLLELLEAHTKASGKKLRLFRDREEFPTSSDLSESIHSALRESRFLILVCSPEYIQSLWCLEEVRYFRSLHGGTNQGILPILVSGEPSESFPPSIFTELLEVTLPDGSIQQIVRNTEPLAADVRSNSLKKSLKILKQTEYIRILAPILGVRFDDLYQREKRRQRKRLRILLCTITAVAVLVISFLLWQLFQVRQSQLHENLVYAEQLFADGDKTDARRKSQEVLDGVLPLMDPQIRQRSKELLFISDFPVPLSVQTHIVPRNGDNRIYFSSDGKCILHFSAERLETYSLGGSLLDTFSLGRKGRKLAAVSPDGSRAVVLKVLSDGSRAMELWDTAQERSLGELLTSSFRDNVNDLQADFSPDGKTLSVCRIGGNYNQNEALYLFSAETGEAVCEIDGYMAGSREKEGVQDRVVEKFEFLNSNTAHWTGSGNHVFYDLDEGRVIQIPRSMEAEYKKAVSTYLPPLLGRYGVVTVGKELKVLDLSADTIRVELADLAALGARSIDCQVYNGTCAVGIETGIVEVVDFLLPTERKKVVKSIYVCDLLSGEAYMETDLEALQWEDPRVLTCEGCPVCWLQYTDHSGQRKLLRLSPAGAEQETADIAEKYSTVVYLGRAAEKDYFAAGTGSGFDLLCYSGTELESALSVDGLLNQFVENMSLAVTEKGVCLTGPYHQDYCLFQLDIRAQLMDSNGQGAKRISVSDNGEHWLQITRDCISLSGKEVQQMPLAPEYITYYRVGNDGTAAVASESRLVIYNSEGKVCFSSEYGRIVSVKLGGNTVFWLTQNGVLYHGVEQRSCTLHSYDLSGEVETTYASEVCYYAEYPCDDMYDCSPSGERVVYLAATQIPQLRMLKVNDPKDALRAESSPFETLQIEGRAGLTGVRFVSGSQLLCTNVSDVALVNAADLTAVCGITEMSPYRKLPELTADGRLVYYGENVDIWNMHSGELLAAIAGNGESALFFSEDSHWFTVANEKGTSLYNAADYQQELQISSLPLEVCVLSEQEFVCANDSGLYRAALK